MRKFILVAMAAMLALASREPGFSQTLRDQPKATAPARRANVQPRRAALQELVLTFYITQLRRVAEVSDEVFVKVLPFLEQFVDDRFEITQRRRRAFNQLQKVVNSGGPDDAILRLVREFDTADAEIQANQQEFMRNVDPLLNTRQQARLRIFLDVSDQRIRQMLNGLQNAPGAQPNRPNLPQQ